MRTLALLLLLGTALAGGAGAPIDTATADASAAQALSRLDTERAEIDREVGLRSQTRQERCSGRRYASLNRLREADGSLRRLVLRRASYGGPEASSIRAYYDHAGELFYVTLYRRNAAGLIKIKAYVENSGVPYRTEFFGPGRLSTDMVPTSLLADLARPEGLIARGVPCGDGPLW